MKNIVFIIAVLFVACKKEDTYTVKVDVYGSGKRYNLIYFKENDAYSSNKIVENNYSESFEYKMDKRVSFAAEVKDSFGWVVIKAQFPDKLLYDSIVGTPGVGARVNN